ncbi:hypothetical protein HCB28_13970 [Listeria sp. FSL L7-0253]|uniref:hypothetical protein n=1 Tax=Listeria cossartiae TaxID=2838249 RepID=UPI001626BA8C|nr:hypothetical protein [Listeria cossartiae]MBC2187282.1 hypothetical protein [Listeria cossartiae subsp. cossartiae]
MSDYSWREKYEAEEKEKFKEQRRISIEKYKNCVNFYDNLSIEEKKYYRHEINYQSIKGLGSISLDLYYPDNHYESVVSGREKAKAPLPKEKISQIIQHIEKEISFFEVWDGAVNYGPELDDNFMADLDKIDFKDRVVDLVSTIFTNEFCLEKNDWDNFKALEVEEKNQEFKKGNKISVGCEETPISEMYVHVSIDLENRAVVQEVVHEEGGKVPIALFQAKTEEELLNKISGFKWNDFVTVDEEAVLEELGLDEKQEYTL